MKKILILTRPLHLILTVLTYSLGLGIARYLGTTLRIEAQFFGGVILVFALAASGLFTIYFRPFNEPIVAGETLAERESLQRLLLAFGVAFLAVAGMFVFFLQRLGFINLEAGLLFAVFALAAFANALPPLRLAARGFGELVDAFLIASLAPMIAFFLQVGDFHRLLTLFTFPLFLIVLACFLALDFPSYADDMKYERHSLLTALSWQQAVSIHNLLFIAAYILLVAGPFLGISLSLIWPVLLTAPIAAYQIFMLRNISNGAAPFWPAFRIIAVAMMGLTAYLMALAFWLG